MGLLGPFARRWRPERTRALVITPGGASATRCCKRVIACLDVRANDNGDLVVTKGDQYDVRGGGDVRNLGKPVSQG